VSLVFPLLIAYGVRLLQPKVQVSSVAVCTALLLVLCTGTVLRNQVWRDETSLWSDVIAKSPHKARPYNSLATIYFNRHQFDRALEVAQRGLQNVENVAARRDFQQTLGQIYIQMHRYEDAAAMFRATAKVEDHRLASLAYNNIGVAYVNMASDRSGSEKERLLTMAAEAFRQSADLDDNMLFAFDSYINALCEIGKKEQLQTELEAKLKEKDYRAYYGLGKMAFLSGDYERAVQHFEEAIGLNSRQKLIFFNEAYALNQLKRRDEAIGKYLQVIRLDPLFVQARNNLGLLYMQSSDFSKAIASFVDALRLDPNYVSAHLNLAKAYTQVGNPSGARDHLQKVLSISPENQEAISLWRKLGS
jgi:tetratricopeptide (TPR) repeat protein